MKSEFTCHYKSIQLLSENFNFSSEIELNSFSQFVISETEVKDIMM